MTDQAALIERIVKDVLEQLQSRPVAPSPSPTTTAKPAPTPSTNTIGLTDVVITAAVLDKSPLKSGSRLVIAPKAVVTPSARDWLRERKITFTRATSQTSATSSSPARWQLFVSTVTPTVRSLIEQVSRSQRDWQRQLTGSAQDTAESVIRAISTAESQRIFVISSAAEGIACRVNRNAKVRAAVVATREQLQSVEQDLCPNVILVNPAAKSLMDLRHLVQACVLLPTPRIPDGF